jgi:hypothetical protein
MRLADMLYNNRNSSGKVGKHVRKVMDEMQERERKRWMEARMFREEALKLKATRILRFGRFAVNVPSINITRYHDYPLPESTATPSERAIDKDICSGVTTYIPGQKHHGVMIPEFITSIEDRERKQKAKIERLQKLKSMNFAPSDDEIHDGFQMLEIDVPTVRLATKSQLGRFSESFSYDGTEVDQSLREGITMDNVSAKHQMCYDPIASNANNNISCSSTNDAVTENAYLESYEIEHVFSDLTNDE